MSTGARWIVGLMLLGVLIGSGFLLLHSGLYGLTFFVLLPVILGGLTSWVVRPSTGWRAAGVGALTMIAALLFLLLIGTEGLICLAMALPLAMPLRALGAWLVYRVEASRAAIRGGVAMLLLLPPAGVTWDTHAQPPIFEVSTTIEIAAPPETVWKHMVSFSQMPEPREWFFRTGLASPKLARLRGRSRGDSLL